MSSKETDIRSSIMDLSQFGLLFEAKQKLDAYMVTPTTKYEDRRALILSFITHGRLELVRHVFIPSLYDESLNYAVKIGKYDIVLFLMSKYDLDSESTISIYNLMVVAIAENHHKIAKYFIDTEIDINHISIRNTATYKNAMRSSNPLSDKYSDQLKQIKRILKYLGLENIFLIVDSISDGIPRKFLENNVYN